MRMLSIVAAISLGTLTGCVAGIEEPAAPTQPMPEFKSPPPAPGMIWVAGVWHWNGVDHVWVPGHWMSPPPAP